MHSPITGFSLRAENYAYPTMQRRNAIDNTPVAGHDKQE
jgi:hypothetical protein